MKVLVCPDSFKGTLSSPMVAETIAQVFRSRNNEVTCVPIADGGEGTLEAIQYKIQGTQHIIKSRDPFRRKIDAHFIVKDRVAYAEYASVCGLMLLKEEELNPWNATSYGFGKILKEIFKLDVDRVVIGIGGSATNDGGVGMLQALGAVFYDAEGELVKEDRAIGFGPSIIKKIAKIDATEISEQIKGKKVEVLSDVTNPLTGFEGTSRVYSPQKGADRMMAERLERTMRYWGNIIKQQYDVDTEFPGSGAAGGLGMALKVFLKAEIIPGIDGMVDLMGLEKNIEENDLIIVGEGSMDRQTIYGKAPTGIAKLAKKYDKKVVAIVGRVGKNINEIFEMGVDAIFACFGENIPDPDTLKLLAEDNLRKISDLAANKIPTYETITNKIFILSR